MSNLTAGKLLVPYSRYARNKLTRFTGPQGRIDLLRKTVTKLVRDERIEVVNYVGYESRQYIERLIELAKKYGNKHEGMMEMADYWLLDKELVPKLFEEIVPKFQSKTGPYTLVHKLPTEYPGSGVKKIVLELKENSLPKIKTQSSVDFTNSLTNVLIRAYQQSYSKKPSSSSSSQ